MSDYYEEYEIIRSGAVAGGGILGTAANGLPGGAVFGIAGGAITDSAYSVISGTPHGYVEDVTNITTDLSKGRSPFRSVTRAGRRLGTDAVSGMVAGKLFCPSAGAIGFI